MGQKRANIEAVAQQAGVAKSTVSRVLNGGHASEAMRERVERAIQRLGYTPLSSAVHFATGRTGVFGVAVSDVKSEWFPPLLSGMEAQLGRGKPTALLIGSFAPGGKYDASPIRSWISKRRIDGLIFVRPRRSEQSIIDAAREAGVALSLIAPDIKFKGGGVFVSNNLRAGQDVGRHLLALGHRHIAFVGGEKHAADSQHRLKGLKSALAEAGVELRDADISHAHYRPEDGLKYAEQWLRMSKRRAPTAVVFANDAMALGFMRTLHQRGVVVPERVSVVGFDDLPAANWIWPRLTTVRQQLEEIGAEACLSVYRQVETPGQPRETKPVEFSTELIVRESTGAAPG